MDDDAVVVIDAAGVHEVAVIGDTEGGRMAMLLALHTARSSRYAFAAVSGDALVCSMASQRRTEAVVSSPKRPSQS